MKISPPKNPDLEPKTDRDREREGERERERDEVADNRQTKTSIKTYRYMER